MNKISDSIHETAQDLHQAGVMNDVTMREFDSLCLPPIKKYSANQIKRIRTKNKASQAVFASYLNTSKSTIQKWEQGLKTPQRPIIKVTQSGRSKGY